LLATSYEDAGLLTLIIATDTVAGEQIHTTRGSKADTMRRNREDTMPSRNMVTADTAMLSQQWAEINMMVRNES
jgi:hypothetical protein